jgi:hypothetical protein
MNHYRLSTCYFIFRTSCAILNYMIPRSKVQAIDLVEVYQLLYAPAALRIDNRAHAPG